MLTRRKVSFAPSSPAQNPNPATSPPSVPRLFSPQALNSGPSTREERRKIPAGCRQLPQQVSNRSLLCQCELGYRSGGPSCLLPMRDTQGGSQSFTEDGKR